MSDKEFWNSTPAKIFALLDYHTKVENPSRDSNKKNRDISELPKMTPELFQRWSGQPIRRNIKTQSR